jgi:hypothetical protein
LPFQKELCLRAKKWTLVKRSARVASETIGASWQVMLAPKINAGKGTNCTDSGDSPTKKVRAQQKR